MAMITGKLNAALWWLHNGFSIIPVHYIIESDGKRECSCGKPDCVDNAGKHPMTHLARNGVDDATQDEETARQWWGAEPNANIAVALGSKKRMCALDVESVAGHGVDGLTNWKEYQERHEYVFPTLAWNTGSGGFNALFRLPDTVNGNTKNTNLCGGVDLRASNSYILVPPSNHRLGESRFLKDGAPSVLPDFLTNALNGKSLGTKLHTDSNNHNPIKLPEKVTIGSRHDALVSLVGTFVKRGIDQQTTLKWTREWNAEHCDPPKDDYHVVETVRYAYDNWQVGELVAPKSTPVGDSTQQEYDEIYIRALDILKNGNPMEFFLNTFKTLHVGDISIAEGILLGTAVQSVLNALGIQSKLTGGKGKGKSHAARSALHLLPQTYVRCVSLTDKAIWYDPKIKTGCTVFSDDVNISPELEGQIKRATSNWQRETERVVPQKSGGKLIGEEQTIPARINFVLTSVASQGSEELIDRQMGYDVDEGQNEAYTAFELERANDACLEFPETDDVRVCREIFRIMKENEDDGTLSLIGVRIPFYKRISWNDVENRRNLNIFLDMVRAFAMLRFMQRDRDDDGNMLATIGDFKAAQQHYGSRGEVQKLHLTSGALRFLQHLRDNNATDEYSAISSTDMRKALKLTAGRISQIVGELDKSLYNFHVLEESVSESDMDGKRTGRKHNLYYVDGGVELNLANYESVVSLKDDGEN